MQRTLPASAAIAKSPEGAGGQNYGVTSCFSLNKAGTVTWYAKACDTPSAHHTLVPCKQPGVVA